VVHRWRRPPVVRTAHEVGQLDRLDRSLNRVSYRQERLELLLVDLREPLGAGLPL
jgi:hypothetical protein